MRFEGRTTMTSMDGGLQYTATVEHTGNLMESNTYSEREGIKRG